MLQASYCSIVMPDVLFHSYGLCLGDARFCSILGRITMNGATPDFSTTPMATTTIMPCHTLGPHLVEFSVTLDSAKTYTAIADLLLT